MKVGPLSLAASHDCLLSLLGAKTLSSIVPVSLLQEDRLLYLEPVLIRASIALSLHSRVQADMVLDTELRILHLDLPATGSGLRHRVLL